jgi:hypothetical protein
MEITVRCPAGRPPEQPVMAKVSTSRSAAILPVAARIAFARNTLLPHAGTVIYNLMP